MTHNAFKFTKNNWSRDGSTYWYRCSANKATGCPASARVKRVEELEPDGSVVVKNYLLEVSTPEVRYKLDNTFKNLFIIRYMLGSMPQIRHP